MLESVHRWLAVSVKSPSHLHFISPQISHALLAACLILTGAAPAAADLWYQHYQKAQEALERERWEAAVEELNQAIERRGDSGARVRTYGMRTTDYFPYLELGVAYLNLGQADAALQAFETEERLGAIEASEEARQRLENYRTKARSAVSERADQERQRIDQILRDSLEEAERLAENGRLDAAMVAVGRGLAVAPEDPAANQLMENFRGEARKLESARQLEDQVDDLVAEGSELLQQGALDAAASRFRQALGLKEDDSEIRNLLEQAQSRLREEIQEQKRAGEVALEVEGALTRVAELEATGSLDEALTVLQSVLAVEPQNPEAQALESRLVTARDRAQREAGDRYAAKIEIAAAAEHFAAGRFEESLTAANRALAFAPGDAVALGLVTRSYQEISRVLLGRSVGGNIPPAIRFADFREEHVDGSYTQVVREPRFRLTGMVIDNSPVDIRLTDSRESQRASEHRRLSSRPMKAT